MYISVVNVGPFVEKVNLNALKLNIPAELSYHIVGVSSAHQVKYVYCLQTLSSVFFPKHKYYLLNNDLISIFSEKVLSNYVILQPHEEFVLRSDTAVSQRSEYFRYIISDL